MKKRSREEYTFSCTLIRSNEKTLLSHMDLQKVLDAKQMGIAMNLLGEFGYEIDKDVVAREDFEQLLDREHRRVHELAFSSVPDKRELNFLLLPIDYHNIKVLLKGEILKKDVKHFMLDGGTIEKDKMVEYIRDRNYIFMSGPMKEGIAATLENYSKERNPQLIDILLDRACYDDMTEEVRAYGNEFLIKYMELSIDLLNIVSCIRLREIGKPVEFFRKIFLEGGTVRERLLSFSYDEHYSKFAERMKPYGFSEIVSLGGAAIASEENYTLLEKLCDNKKIAYIKDATYISMGIEPIAAFLIAKEYEIKNLRMIFSGKIGGVPEEVTLERLRDTYV